MGYTQALADLFDISTDELIYGRRDTLTEIPMDSYIIGPDYPQVASKN